MTARLATITRRIFQPTQLLAQASEPLFRFIRVDDDWLAAIQTAATRGPVVYVLPNVSVLDYSALVNLTHRLDLPRIGFVNGLPHILSPQTQNGTSTTTEQLCDIIAAGHSAALFLKQAPHRVGGTSRGRSGAHDLLGGLLSFQEHHPDLEIMMVPQIFVWSRRSERRGFSWFDTIFGPADFPGELRMGLQFARNFKNCEVRAGQLLSLRDFITEAQDLNLQARIQRLSFVLNRSVQRERRSILGPVHKAAERVREEVLRTPKLQAVIAELAGPGRRERELLYDKARNIMRRMQALPDTEAIASLALAVTTMVDRVFSGIDLDEEGLEALREATKRGSVVLLPSHKSHVDYLVVSWLMRRRAIQVPVIAAGDNLSFFPLGPVLRRGGAFFIRRKFRRDRLYSAVVDAYVRRLLRDGWMFEFFLEGTRSRTGKLLAPKLGMLTMVVAAALELEARPLIFVPISIGYERLIEEKAYEKELSGSKKTKESPTALLKASEVLRDRWGRINIQFGRPFELGPILASLGVQRGAASDEELTTIVQRVAHQTMSEINSVTALSPGSIVALVLLCHGRRGMVYEDLLKQCQKITSSLVRRGARTTPSLTPPGSDALRPQAIREALGLYLKSGLVEQHVVGQGLTTTKSKQKRTSLHRGKDAIFTVPDTKRLRLDLAKNTIVHWLVDRALVAVSLLVSSQRVDGLTTVSPEASMVQGGVFDEEPPLYDIGEEGDRAGEDKSPPPIGTQCIRAATVRGRVQSLSRLFKFEFMFRADAGFDQIFDDVLAAMVKDGEISLEGDTVSIGTGHDEMDGRYWLGLYASALQNFLEGYRIAARSLGALLRGAMTDKDLYARALRVGEQMFLQGEIERAEAVSRPIISNAVSAFVDQGYLVRHDNKLALAGSFESEQGIRAVEARIASFLPERRGDLL